METETYTSFGVVPVFRVPAGDFLFCVVHHASGHWGFPKGHQNEGESEKETAVRELSEETGITNCDILSDDVFIEKYSFKKDDINYIKTVKYFLGIAPSKIVETPIEFKQEIPGSKWLPYAEAKNILPFSESKAVLDEAFEYLKHFDSH
jgi:bis(5'-nucleosidyl)-tetraphosphatase